MRAKTDPRRKQRNDSSEHRHWSAGLFEDLSHRYCTHCLFSLAPRTSPSHTLLLLALISPATKQQSFPYLSEIHGSMSYADIQVGNQPCCSHRRGNHPSLSLPPLPFLSRSLAMTMHTIARRSSPCLSVRVQPRASNNTLHKPPSSPTHVKIRTNHLLLLTVAAEATKPLVCFRGFLHLECTALSEYLAEPRAPIRIVRLRQIIPKTPGLFMERFFSTVRSGSERFKTSAP